MCSVIARLLCRSGRHQRRLRWDTWERFVWSSWECERDTCTWTAAR